MTIIKVSLEMEAEVPDNLDGENAVDYFWNYADEMVSDARLDSDNVVDAVPATEVSM